MRHLLYSVYASKHSDEWFLNIRELCKYSSVFTGKKIVIIRSDENTVDPANVEKEFTFPATFVHVQNTPLHEAKGFIELLKEFYTNNTDEILFYAHTKGTSYTADHPRINAVRSWRNALYRNNLTSVDEIDRALNTYGCAGSFLAKNLANRPYFPKETRYFYAGSFWWVNLARLFSKPSWDAPQTSPLNVKYLTEWYLDSQFDRSEMYCISYNCGNYDVGNLSVYSRFRITYLKPPVPSLSIIIPTIGRKSLSDILKQLIKQIGENDEIIVSGDGKRYQARTIVEAVNDPRITYIEGQLSPPGDIGYTARNNAISIARKSHLYFIDDDDRILPGAIETIKAGIIKDPYKILLFKIKHSHLGVLWKVPTVRLGNISTQMFVVPNLIERIGKWEAHKSECGDYRFIMNTLALSPRTEPIVWHDEIIACQEMQGDRSRHSNTEKRDDSNERELISIPTQKSHTTKLRVIRRLPVSVPIANKSRVHKSRVHKRPKKRVPTAKNVVCKKKKHIVLLYKPNINVG